MQIFDENLDRKQSHLMLDSIVCPRPIFFITTKSKNGILNLAPYSMSSIASTNPSMICYSSVIHPDGLEKDTLVNIRETGEFVINMVTENILDDVLVAAKRYPPEVNEFEYTKLTTTPAVRINPPRIVESPVNMECTVHQIIPLGQYHSLIIGRVLVFHVDDSVFTGQDIDPFKLNIIGRMGGSYFVKAKEIFSLTDKWDLSADLAKEG